MMLSDAKNSLVVKAKQNRVALPVIHPALTGRDKHPQN
jgi:hypothetical protein